MKARSSLEYPSRVCAAARGSAFPKGSSIGLPALLSPPFLRERMRDLLIQSCTEVSQTCPYGWTCASFVFGIETMRLVEPSCFSLYDECRQDLSPITWGGEFRPGRRGKPGTHIEAHQPGCVK